MDKIVNKIYDRVVTNFKNTTDISLLTGSSGNILFLGYLYNSCQLDCVRYKFEELLEYTIDLINHDSSRFDLTYGGGMSGFCWVINHLYHNKILLKHSRILKDIISVDTEIEIIESMNADFLSSKYDPFYGYIGKGLYFLTKPESSVTRQVINAILDALRKDRVRINDQITWIDVRRAFDESNTENERLILADCGQAHGVTGIISFLALVIERFKSKSIREKATELLTFAADWLISQEISPELRGSKYMFPYSVNLLDTNKKIINNGRLAWCYGDNIIAYALYKAGSILNKTRYTIKADEIIFNCCQISDKDSGVFDLGKGRLFNPTLCHGAAGVALIYEGIYQYNKSSMVKNSISHWRKLTKHYTSLYLEDRSLKSLFDNNNEAYEYLYGYSGIGLYIISSNNSRYSWANSMIINMTND